MTGASGIPRLPLGITRCQGPAATAAHAAAVASALGGVGANLVLLRGELGAGKTCWAAGFAAALGFPGPITSPTYTILNVHRRPTASATDSGGDTGSGAPCPAELWHLDLFRVSCFEELFDLGLVEALDRATIIVIEWPDRVAELFAMPHLLVDFAVIGELDRELAVSRGAEPGASRSGCPAGGGPRGDAGA